MLSWPAKRDVIGQGTQRVDAPAKVTGAAKYSSDVQPEGWLYGMIYRSRWPAARVTSVNIEKAKQIPGIKAVVVERDGAIVLIDPVSLDFLKGAEIDFSDDLIGAAFKVKNPNAQSSCGCGTSFSV